MDDSVVIYSPITVGCWQQVQPSMRNWLVPLDTVVFMMGVRREEIPQVEKGGKCFICQKQPSAALLVTAACRPALKLPYKFYISGT